MIDAHAHLVRLPGESPVHAWILPGVDEATDAAAARLAELDSRIRTAVGLHPWHLPPDDRLERALLRLAATAREGRPVAIGETGLDKGRRGGPMPAQRLAFVAQLRLAKELDLPLILHVVRTHGACLQAIREVDEEGEGDANQGPPLRGMVHDFGGPTEVVRDWVAAGFFLSVSPRGLDRPAAIRAIPGERLLVETDDEGPERLSEVIERVAAIRGLTPEDVAAVTTANARRLFGL